MWRRPSAPTETPWRAARERRDPSPSLSPSLAAAGRARSRPFAFGDGLDRDLPLRARIERVAQRIPEQVEAEHRESNRDAGEQRGPRRAAQLTQIAAVGDHRPPAWRWGLH